MGSTDRPAANAAIPVLRIFDRAKAYEFYRDFLGFEVVWEHRFEPDLPLYAEVRRDGIRLHLSEHHGDASPGAAVIVEVDDARALQQRLLTARYGFARPGLSDDGWALTVTVTDPFHNRIVFAERTGTTPPSDRVPPSAD